MVRSSAKGFTLLEVVIAMALLAILAIASSQSIQQSIRSKLKIEVELEDVSRVRDSLRIMERDLNMAFHYQDIEKELEKEVKTRSKKTTTSTTLPLGPDGTPYTPEEAPEILSPEQQDLQRNRLDPTTQFWGAEQEVYFVTLNGGRLLADTQQADYLHVGYRLQDCRRPGKNSKSSKCLVRLTSPVAEGDVKENLKSQMLLENVSEFKMRYIGPGKQDWNSSWDSKGTDGAIKGQYPSLVEINLGIEKEVKESKRKISMQMIIPIRFPNNAKPSKK